VSWEVLLHPEFLPEFEGLPEGVQEEIAALTHLLKRFGPELSRPHVDTLKGSRFSNMKELRFRQDGVWRIAFAFDVERKAILLVGGDKGKSKSQRFYKNLIQLADRRFQSHLDILGEG